MCRCSPDSSLAASQQTIVWRERDEICIRILKRKNRQQGSGTIRRKCSCQFSERLCPVHKLWDGFFAHLEEGVAPWGQLTPNYVRLRLRRILDVLKIPDSAKYGTHDFRRGHAEDLRLNGSTFAEILRAGQWKSAPFMSYLEDVGLERDVAYHAAICDEEKQFVD